MKLIWSPETADDFDQAITCLVSVDPVATAGRWGHAVTFFRDLMPILEAGHLPCGWQGRWPRGSLVVL